MQPVHNIEASSEAQDKEMKRLTKLEESDTLHNKLLLPPKQLPKSKVAKAAKKIKTKVRSCPQIKKEVKKEKIVSYRIIQYILLLIL
jgi:hypothetical protein